MDKILVKGKFNAIKHSFYKGVLLVVRSGCHHEGIECFSRYEEMPGLRSGNLLPKISNYLRTYPTSFPGAQIASLSTLSSLQGLLVSSGSSTGRWQTPLLLLYGCWQMLLASASLWLTGRCQLAADNLKLFMFMLCQRFQREKAMATHSSILVKRILWTEEPGGLLSTGSHRVRHD